jgi:hypothetical protein
MFLHSKVVSLINTVSFLGLSFFWNFLQIIKKVHEFFSNWRWWGSPLIGPNFQSKFSPFQPILSNFKISTQFCCLWVEQHAKFQNTKTTPSQRKVIKETRQAGAELCQAQDKLGLAWPALPSKKLRSSSLQSNV